MQISIVHSDTYAYIYLGMCGYALEKFLQCRSHLDLSAGRTPQTSPIPGDGVGGCPFFERVLSTYMGNTYPNPSSNC